MPLGIIIEGLGSNQRGKNPGKLLLAFPMSVPVCNITKNNRTD